MHSGIIKYKMGVVENNGIRASPVRQKLRERLLYYMLMAGMPFMVMFFFAMRPIFFHALVFATSRKFVISFI
jgi:hypothetical protein